MREATDCQTQSGEERNRIHADRSLPDVRDAGEGGSDLPQVQSESGQRSGNSNSKGERRMGQLRLQFEVVGNVPQGGSKACEGAEDSLGKEDRRRVGFIAQKAAAEEKAALAHREAISTRQDVGTSHCQRIEKDQSSFSAMGFRPRSVEEESMQRANQSQKEGKTAAGSVAVIAILESQNYECAACGMSLEPEVAELDHKRALSDGGDDDPSNLQWLCKPCNRAKRDMSMGAFVAMCRRIAKRHESTSLLPPPVVGSWETSESRGFPPPSPISKI